MATGQQLGVLGAKKNVVSCAAYRDAIIADRADVERQKLDSIRIQMYLLARRVWPIFFRGLIICIVTPNFPIIQSDGF